MGKQRKTRQQKIIAELRRQIQINATPAFSLPSSPIPKPTTHKYTVENRTSTQTLHSNAFLIKDLKKTAFLTAALIFFEALLSILLRLHIIAIKTLAF